MQPATTITAELDGFVKLLTSHQSRLYAFIHAQLADADLARDVFQETNLVLWRKATKYDAARPFLPWAFGIARNQVRAARTRAGRNRLLFSEEAVQRIADAAEATAEHHDDRQLALAGCLQRLSEEDRRIISLRYQQGHEVRQIARELKRSASAMGVAIFRIRKSLSTCIKNQLARRAAP